MKKTERAKPTPGRAHMAPHAPEDRTKLAGMIRTLRSGGSLPPILWDGDGAYEGSHRLAAYEAVGMEPELIQVDDEMLNRAADHLGQDVGMIDWYDEIAVDALHRAQEDAR